jgi:hypothetical protein
MSQRFVFVDSRLSPNEQVAFLGMKVRELDISSDPDGGSVPVAA